MARQRTGAHRRGHPVLAGAALCLAVCALVQAAVADDANLCADDRDHLFVNGRIHTMDADGRVVDAVRVAGNRFVATGGDAGQPGPCTRVIDLRGRTAIPGIIDNHNHIVLLGLRPGHDTRLENARSIEEVLDTLQERAVAVPPGEWITSIGGFDINQFVPPPGQPRFPTLDELDGVTPGHPVYLQQAFAGPGVTNSLGREYLEAHGVEVGEDGAVAGGFQLPNAATRALHALRQLQTDEDRRRGTLEAMRYAASLGVTTHLDQAGFPASGSAADGAADFDHDTAYDALFALHRDGELINRVRLNFLHVEDDPQTPELAARLRYTFPRFGDAMLRTLGIGEFTAGNGAFLVEGSEAWLEGTRRVAEAGWRNENHSLTPNDFITVIEGWEAVNERLPPPGITELRWVLAHVPFITREYAQRLHALGGGVSVLGGWRWLSGSEGNAGPPFRMLRETGIRMGMSSDGMQISPLNPWIGLYYVVTGRNARGEAINAEQTLPREDALRLYTADNGWFLGEEDDLGTIEPGRYADMVVLSDDYFDAAAVPDEAIPAIRSLLTVVDGRIVHGDPEAL